MENTETYTAFETDKLLCRGGLAEVVLKVKRRSEKSAAPILIFSDQTGKFMDFNFQGSESEVLKRLEVYLPSGSAENTGPGRPKIGVVSREVSLLPRHWEWLATQEGGASASLRRLVEQEKKKSLGTGEIKKAQERTYKFMSVLAGDLENYEEALRALYRKDESTFSKLTAAWPKDIRRRTLELASPTFA